MKKIGVLFMFSALVLAGCKKKEKENPTTPPTITLNGSSTMALAVGDTYSEPGAKAKDVNGKTLNVTINSSNLNTSVAGSYQVVYTAKDSYGNTAQKSRTIDVAITTANWVGTWTVNDDFKACTPAANILDDNCTITEFLGNLTLDHNGKTFDATVTGNTVTLNTKSVSLNLGACTYDVSGTGTISEDAQTITIDYTRTGTCMLCGDGSETVEYTKQ